jgi:hypothetical protein
MTTELDMMKLYSPQDVADVCECSAQTIKRIADELRLATLRTVGGVRLFTHEQVVKIQAERERRERERRNG